MTLSLLYDLSEFEITLLSESWDILQIVFGVIESFFLFLYVIHLADVQIRVLDLIAFRWDFFCLVCGKIKQVGWFRFFLINEIINFMNVNFHSAVGIELLDWGDELATFLWRFLLFNFLLVSECVLFLLESEHLRFFELWYSLRSEEFRLYFLFNIIDDEGVLIFEELRGGENFASDLWVLIIEVFFMVNKFCCFLD